LVQFFSLLDGQTLQHRIHYIFYCYRKDKTMKQETEDRPVAHLPEAGGVHTKVEFDNARVRVIRFHFGAHAKIPMHDAPDVVSIALTDGHLRLTLPDGTVRDKHYRVGDTDWVPAQSHAGENMADTPLEFIAVQLKR
jgi:beta-alanine degradation protein BauB